MSRMLNNKDLLILKNISHIYDQESQKIKVLNNVNIRVLKGEMISLIGPSGTGKSTLLNIAGLLEKPTFGSINLSGHDCTKLSEDNKTFLRGKEIGFIFQTHRLFQEFSALENVMIPQLIMGKSKLEAEKKSRELLSALGLKNRLEFRPAKLSGGEAQRVAISRAVINSPEIILADEPSGSLDHKNSKEIFKLLFKLKNKNRVLIYATHNLYFAKMADYKLQIHDGKIKTYNARI